MNAACPSIPAPISRLHLIAALVLGSMLLLHAETSVTKPALVPSPSTNTAPVPSAAASPAAASDADSDDDSPRRKSGHGDTITITTEGSRHPESMLSQIANDLIVPAIAIVIGCATPVLIIFFFFHFRNHRRQANLALAREFLNKGLPVPPQLLDESLRPGDYAVAPNPVVTTRCPDTRKGIKYIFIGLGVSLALYAADPHSTDWAWGLIPAIAGCGYFLSGWMEDRSAAAYQAQKPPAGPGSGPTP